MQGVNLPNLFILTYKDNHNNQFYINAFNRGLIFSRQDIENYINELHLVPQNSFFEPCDSLEIVRRALRNLIMSFEKIGEHAKADEHGRHALRTVDEEREGDANQDKERKVADRVAKQRRSGTWRRAVKYERTE